MYTQLLLSSVLICPLERVGLVIRLSYVGGFVFASECLSVYVCVCVDPLVYFSRVCSEIHHFHLPKFRALGCQPATKHL